MEGGRGANPAADLVEACDEHRQIADFALALPSRESFRGQLFSYLDGAIGFDLATAAHTPDGARFEVHARGELDVAAMRERLWQYLGELDPRESEAPFCDRPVVDSAFLSMARKSQLSIYREVWRPAGLSVLMLALWRNRFGGFGLVLGRSGRGVCFRESEVELLARCLPQIRLSEALMSGAEDSVFDRWSQRVGLSRREREIAALVARGLRNREIAEVLEVSPLTVRNQLAAVFRKAEVTTRAELVGAMHWREAGGLAIPYCAGGARKGG